MLIEMGNIVRWHWSSWLVTRKAAYTRLCDPTACKTDAETRGEPKLITQAIDLYTYRLFKSTHSNIKMYAQIYTSVVFNALDIIYQSFHWVMQS